MSVHMRTRLFVCVLGMHFFVCVLTKMLLVASSLHVMCCAQAGETVYHIVAATYNARDIAEELLHLDCPLDAPDEDVRSCIIVREIATHMHVFLSGQHSLTRGLLERQSSSCSCPVRQQQEEGIKAGGCEKYQGMY